MTPGLGPCISAINKASPDNIYMKEVKLKLLLIKLKLNFTLLRQWQLPA